MIVIKKLFSAHPSGQAPVKAIEAARNAFQFDDEGLNQAATP